MAVRGYDHIIWLIFHGSPYDERCKLKKLLVREKDGSTHRAPIFEPLPTDAIQVSEGLSQFGSKTISH